MANRSDEVFIYLRAIGAAKTRRDIESVADSLERLESGTEEHTDAVNDLTEAQEENTKRQKENKKAVDDNTKSSKKSASAIGMVDRATIKTNNTLKYNTMALKQKIAQTKASIAADEKAAKATERLNEKLSKQQKQLDAANKQRRENVWRQSVKARAQYEKEMLSIEDAAAKARKKKIDGYIKQMEDADRRTWKIRNDTLKARLAFDRQELKAIERHDKAVLAQEVKTQKARSNLVNHFKPRGLPSFARPGRVLLYATAILGILDLLPVVGTALNATLAGAIGAVNGLLPMLSIFGSLPALILGGIQGMTVMTIVAKGIGKALKGSGVLSYWTDLGLAIQDAGAKGIEKTFGNLTQALMPTLMKQLVETAKIFNSNITGAAGWFGSSAGKNTVNALLIQGNGLLETFLGGIGQLGIAFFNMGVNGGSVLSDILGDFDRLSTYLANITGDNGGAISDYMDNAWKSTKRASGVVGNFIESLYNIFRLSHPVTKLLADGIENASEKLLKWTESEGGIKAIKDYFTEMVPNLKAMARFGGASAKMIFRISRSKNFQSIMDEITTNLVPALEQLITSLDGNFIKLLVQMVENLGVLANSGVADVLIDIGNAAVGVITGLVNFYESLPDGAQAFAVWSFVILGFFGGMATRAIAYIMGIAKAWKALKMQLGAGAKLGAITGGGIAAGGKGGKGTAAGAARKSAVVAGGGSGKNMASGSGSTAIVPAGGKGKKGKTPKAPKAPRVSGGGGAMAGGAAAALFFAAPIVDSLSGASKAFDDLDYKASVSLNNITTNSAPVGPALNNIFAGNANGNFNTFGEALDRIANPNKWQSFGNGLLNVTSAVTGATNPLDAAKAQFSAIDTQLTNMPYGQATAGFSAIRDQAVAQKVPMDKLVGLFPNLRDRMRQAAIQANGTAGQFDDAGFAADAMAGDVKGLEARIKNLPPKTKAEIKSTLDKSGINAAYTELAKVDGKTATTYIRTVYQRQVEDLNNATRGGMDLDVFFAGGVAQAGKMALGGELGPELAMSRSGKLGMIGLNGPELFMPSANTAIIPNSATSNLMSGDYGNAPDWAGMALQSAANNTVAKSTPATSKGGTSAPSNSYAFDFSGANFGGGSDTNAVKEAVLRAIEEADRDKRERR